MVQTTTYRQQSQTAPCRRGRYGYLFAQAKETGRPIADTDMALTPLANTWPGNTAGVGVFDGIYKDANGKIYFIEAKGGNSTPGSRKIKYNPALEDIRAQQGTKEYMDDIIANMRKKAEDLEDDISNLPSGQEKEALIELKNDLDRTLDAIDEVYELGENGIEYIQIRQKFKSDGDIGNIEIEKFKIWE